MGNGANDPVPPGKLGLPFLGETLALLRNPFRFLEMRQQRYGNVFKSRVLGRTTVFLAGIEGAEAFYDGEHYKPILEMRLKAGKSKAILVDGYNG